ncbi:MAG TPA: rRNA maturation RNase YbeY [bacterium]|nr:rRNA maturation RNase YbeY [bacterium]
MAAFECDIADRATRPHPFRVAGIPPLMAELAGRLLGGRTAEVAVTLVSDRHMRTLNAQHRGKDKTTDVLSFPQEDALRDRLPEFPDWYQLVLGDIVISPVQCLKQAEEWGWTPGERLAQLLIHGFLHLLGYDHEAEEDRAEMEALEEELFRRCESSGLIAGLA